MYGRIISNTRNISHIFLCTTVYREHLQISRIFKNANLAFFRNYTYIKLSHAIPRFWPLAPHFWSVLIHFRSKNDHFWSVFWGLKVRHLLVSSGNTSPPLENSYQKWHFNHQKVAILIHFQALFDLFLVISRSEISPIWRYFVSSTGWAGVPKVRCIQKTALPCIPTESLHRCARYLRPRGNSVDVEWGNLSPMVLHPTYLQPRGVSHLSTHLNTSLHIWKKGELPRPSGRGSSHLLQELKECKEGL